MATRLQAPREFSKLLRHHHRVDAEVLTYTTEPCSCVSSHERHLVSCFHRAQADRVGGGAVEVAVEEGAQGVDGVNALVLGKEGGEDAGVKFLKGVEDDDDGLCTVFDL